MKVSIVAAILFALAAKPQIVSSIPEVQDCTGGTVLITEIAAPIGTSASYIELYFPDCSDQLIGDQLNIVHFPNGEVEESVSSIDIKNLDIDENGFSIICNSNEVPDVFVGIECNKIADADNYPQIVNGIPPAIAIKRFEVTFIGEQLVPTTSYVDMFGHPGDTQYLPDINFINGRASRKRSSMPSGPFFVSNEWDVLPGREGVSTVGVDGMDPREWEDPPATGCNLIITEVANEGFRSFVELYSDNCSDAVLGDKYKLVFGTESEAILSLDAEGAIDLEGKYIGSGGFLVLCEGSMSCDDNVNFMGDIGSMATALVLTGDEDGEEMPVIHDILGRVDGADESQYGLDDITGEPFTLALRDRSYDMPTNVWQPQAWIIDEEGYEPNPYEWEGEAPLVLIINELFNPELDGENRFIELFSPNKRNYEIKDALTLVRTRPNGSEETFDLQGLMVNDRGFLVICRSDSSKFNAGGVWEDRCDYPLDLDPTASNIVADWEMTDRLEIIEYYGSGRKLLHVARSLSYCNGAPYPGAGGPWGSANSNCGGERRRNRNLGSTSVMDSITLSTFGDVFKRRKLQVQELEGFVYNPDATSDDVDPNEAPGIPFPVPVDPVSPPVAPSPAPTECDCACETTTKKPKNKNNKSNKTKGGKKQGKKKKKDQKMDTTK